MAEWPLLTTPIRVVARDSACLGSPATEARRRAGFHMLYTNWRGNTRIDTADCQLVSVCSYHAVAQYV